MVFCTLGLFPRVNSPVLGNTTEIRKTAIIQYQNLLLIFWSFKMISMFALTLIFPNFHQFDPTVIGTATCNCDIWYSMILFHLDVLLLSRCFLILEALCSTSTSSTWPKRGPRNYVKRYLSAASTIQTPCYNKWGYFQAMRLHHDDRMLWSFGGDDIHYQRQAQVEKNEWTKTWTKTYTVHGKKTYETRWTSLLDF